MEGFEILTECMCLLIFLSLSGNLVTWYELNKKYWNILLSYPILSYAKRKPTWLPILSAGPIGADPLLGNLASITPNVTL